MNYVSYKDLFYIVLFLILVVIVVSLCILLLEYKLEQKSRDLKKLNLQLAQLTIQDHLTKLPNRNFVEEYVKQLIINHRKSRKEIAILYIDLDRFKVVNDAFGHEIGDQLLIAVVQRMQILLNHKNKLVRIGGDEFLLIIEDSHLNEAVHIAQNALDLIQHTYVIGGRKVTISASIGIAIYPQHGVSYKDLLINADIAMYSSKQRGRNAYRVYNETLDAQHLKSELLLENDLYKAVEEKQFILLYQPKFNDQKQLCGVEALIRWQHPKLGILGPDLFIDKAERTGLIIPIGYWVLQQACHQIQKWEKSEQPFYPIAINLSALQFEHHALFENLEHALQTYQINPEHLSIEITETTAMRDIDLSVKSFERLRQMGIKIAIDDFGTGYSSFSYLKDLPVDELKIDKEFITDLIADSKEEAILASIIELATKLGLTVTAEGVETSEQAEILIKLGCQQLQGFFFAKPMTAEVLQQFKFEN
ncbi:putative bifunctional diguanylate cyclase/phosphodiesterase [Acinetobacter puyangensis]|uniref:putative bifunctional diguanylate cyclase/phosphodiesterase n=1 Tax=Acinetobacter puyangensis TaxID=1096779 RepID=UPI00148BD50E|nr:EAL domain-containing protein [Acinetobacter puyangensis]